MRLRRGPPPLLRTPPFPHTDPGKVAIGAPANIPEPFDPGRGERLLAAIAKAQVGGGFWSPDDPWSTPLPARATGDSDHAAIAAIRGLPLVLTRAGRFGTPETGPDRAAVARHLLAETRYRDPFTGARIPPERAVDILAFWRRQIDANRGIAVAMGIAWWKRRQIEAFLWSGTTPRFARRDAAGCRLAARAGGGIAVWPSRVSTKLLVLAGRAGVPIIRVEDGFIRSVGLGSALHPPYSVTVDRLGIHYDPAAPSELEQILETTAIPADLLARAAKLRETIVARGISKYGAGSQSSFPQRQPRKRLVLVTGQVSDDLSVRHGGSDVAGNLDLLRRARACESEAEIWFRPHPDVDAGHRNGAIPDAEALRHADHIVRGGGMAELLDTVDGLHVLTSLAGFEALLRGRDVTVHGTPFYGGWGLTRDLAPSVSRRTRTRTLDELVAATLILYPRYLDPETSLPCEVETLVSRFAGRMKPRLSLVHRIRSVQGRLTRRRL